MKKKVRKKKSVKNKKFKSIGGWLLIPTVLFILNGMFLSYLTITFFYIIFTTKIEDFFLTAGIICTFLFFSVIYLLILEFRKKKIFVFWAKTYLIFLLIVAIIFGSLLWIEESRDITFSFKIIWEFIPWFVQTYILEILAVILGVIYLNKSKRVKNTFVN